MARILQMGLARARFVAFYFTVTLLIAVPLAGCGAKGGGRLSAPANAGSAEALAGTSWIELESNVTYNFVDEENVDVIRPEQDEPILGTFEVHGGIVDLSLGLKILNGTWDGNVLVIEGKPLSRNQES